MRTGRALRSNGEGDPQFSTTFHRWLKLTRSIKAVNKTLLKAENQIDGFLKLPIRFLLKNGVVFMQLCKTTMVYLVPNFDFYLDNCTKINPSRCSLSKILISRLKPSLHIHFSFDFDFKKLKNLLQTPQRLQYFITAQIHRPNLFLSPSAAQCKVTC